VSSYFGLIPSETPAAGDSSWGESASRATRFLLVERDGQPCAMTRSWIAFIVVRQHRALAKVAVARWP
jgi:hypothetical protein